MILLSLNTFRVVFKSIIYNIYDVICLLNVERIKISSLFHQYSTSYCIYLQWLLTSTIWRQALQVQDSLSYDFLYSVPSHKLKRIHIILMVTSWLQICGLSAPKCPIILSDISQSLGKCYISNFHYSFTIEELHKS